MSSSNISINFSSMQQNFKQLSLSTLCKSIAISGLILFVFYSLFLYGNPYKRSTDLFMPFMEYKWPVSLFNHIPKSPTNISDIVFVIIGSKESWKYRKPYVEAWWRENITRGHLWFDEAPTEEIVPWPSSFPPFRVNQDISKSSIRGLELQLRMYHSILEAFRVEKNNDVKWYVMAHDDTIIFVDNLVEMLGKYDHTKYYYIGTNSESIRKNAFISFDMGSSGAGYALSFPLVEALALKLEGCISKYQQLFFSDHISQSCLADLGVDLTLEKGIHQIDLRGDISGFLSSHRNTPLISLHHLDFVDPIFPSKNRSESVNHLMTAAKFDQSRLLQQVICYHRQSNWTFSISWGYSTHIYQSILPRSSLIRPLKTYQPWEKGNYEPPFYMFNSRLLPTNSCQIPHVFFLNSISESNGGYQVVSNYIRNSPDDLPTCSSNSNHSANPINKIQVFSPATGRKEVGRAECCDVEYVVGKDTADITLRACMKGEMLA